MLLHPELYNVKSNHTKLLNVTSPGLQKWQFSCFNLTVCLDLFLEHEFFMARDCTLFLFT